NSNEIFNWDGHNEFWSGRTIPLFRTYPSDLQNNIYGDGLIWTSALSEISNLIGKEKTDQLAIQTLFGFYENMLLIDAGVLLLQNDTLLNNAENADLIYIVLCNKGLYPSCEDTNSTTLPLRNPFLGKTEAFFNGGNELIIYPNKTIINSYSVYDIKGQLIETQTISSEGLAFLDIELNLPPRGFYLLTLYTNEGLFTFKLIRPIR
ncbi:MAG: T9SS type A sorting domain-containing protein, partial [Salibacteraceae bacterium]|nr:T9SS type A sorting domain-containing protein [Salibacteraceae bacterium]MDP4763484.1 T9SS type A sorting domain-containing protein [Salibacteraceae bacterium]MDP4965585.1 T9SS type A sorting domain-containing protein [Salibacteraceae bacterium]